MFERPLFARLSPLRRIRTGTSSQRVISQHPLSTLVCAATTVALTACAMPPQGNDNVVYQPTPLSGPIPARAEYGRVENIGYVQTASRPSGAGAVLGAVLGAVVGNQFGAGMGRGVATGAGAVGGAIAGNAVEGRTKRDDEVYRVQVRFDNGSVRDFDFHRVDDLRIGDRVKLEDDQIHRM